jgi:glycosyltransferase involved in cell wall biosynthesis
MSVTSAQPPATAAKPLAIIIPAYKAKFLREALASVAAQTDKNFQLYVFDDGSPEPVGEIVREFTGKLPIRLHRFEDNLGRISLVGQWERCVRQTSEPWVWIFADDDVMEAGCVADFYAELKRTQSAHDLYRFNTVWIDGTGARISESPQHPALEGGVEFLLARLSLKRNVTLQEIIFSRSAWESAGGIPNFPMGWHADEAFTASLGVRQPLCAIPGARVNWRFSELNISSATSFTATNQKIIASTEFFQWVVNFFNAHAADQAGAAIRISEDWLMNYLRTCWVFLGLRTCLALETLGREAWHHPPGWGLSTGLLMNLKLLAHKVEHRLAGRAGRRGVELSGVCPGPRSKQAGQPAPKILFVTSHDLDSADYGAVVRARNLCKLLGRLGEVRVVLAGFREAWGEHPAGTCGGFPLLRRFRFEWSEHITVADRIRHVLDPRFMNNDWFLARREDTDWLKQAAAEHDLVWVHGLNLANRCNIWRWPRGVLDVDDIISGVHRTHQATVGGFLKKINAGRKTLQWRWKERLIHERFDACCVCSEPDRLSLGHLEKTFVVPNGFIPPKAGQVRAPVTPPRVGFIGSFEYEPNVQGVQWFVREVWPQILKKNPAARLRLVGTGSREQAWPAGQNIEPLGWLADVEGEMATWSVSVVPIHIGGGTRVKIAELFSRRCPVVSTSLGVYGYEVADGHEIFIADDAENFGARCGQILGDRALGEELAENAWKKFRERWTWDAQAGRVAAVLERVLAAPKCEP